VLELNTLGDAASRHAYREALVRYFTERRAHLSDDSLHRLERNPLRILDSKDDSDKRVTASAPAFDAYLTDEARRFFDEVRSGLERLGIAYRLSPRLVRGLDYYCHTAFEFVTTDLGAQGTVLGGGRYDGLMGVMGGPETPGVGWAAGIERLALLIDEPSPSARPVAIIPVGDKGEAAAQQLAHRLRRAGFAVDVGFSGNVGRRLKRANKINARAAVILGEDELARDAVGLRDLDTTEQIEVPIAELEDRLAPFR
jgi:histidyl-tRNA synthetase